MPSRVQSMPLLSATVRKVKSAVLLPFLRGVQNVSRQPFFSRNSQLRETAGAVFTERPDLRRVAQRGKIAAG